MAFLLELGVFGVIASLAFAVIFALTWAVGSPFGLAGRHAAWLAVAFLGICLPAFANVHIAVRGSDGASARARACAAVRAFGMLVCAAVLTAPLTAPGLSFRYAVALFIGGSVLWWGSCFWEDKPAEPPAPPDRPRD
jgi:hypothetical protein